MHAWWLLAFATLITGISYGLQKLFQRNSYKTSPRVAYVHNYIASFFPALLFVFIIRSFLVDFCLIPSGSMQPTLECGDRLVASKSTYGLRLPLLGTRLLAGKNPQRGDVIIFRFPLNPKILFIKRIIGLPGDRIQYRNKQLIINGKPIPQKILKITDTGAISAQENLMGRRHVTYISTSHNSPSFEEKILDMNHHLATTKLNKAWTVPQNHYFVMGDNRDNSLDSRTWGFLPEHYILGKAKLIFFSWDSKAPLSKPLSWVRWSRIGQRVK